MIIDIDIQDSIEPALKRLLEHNVRYLRAVTKSVGWYAQKEIKAGIRSGSPNGSPFVERVPYYVRKALSPTAKHAWFGSLVNAVGYQYSDGSVRIGWTSRSASAYGNIQENGIKKQVTANMRKYWSAKGVPLSSSTTELSVPARPIFEPMSRKLEREVPGYVAQKMESYLNENVEFGSKNPKRRKYKVYG